MDNLYFFHTKKLRVNTGRHAAGKSFMNLQCITNILLRIKLLLWMFLIAATSWAQRTELSKQEKKEWKKKAKEYAKSPANLKLMTEEKQAAEAELASANQRLSQIQSTMSNKRKRS